MPFEEEAMGCGATRRPEVKDSGETDDEAKRRSRGVVVGRSGMRRQRGVQPGGGGGVGGADVHLSRR